MGDNVMKGQNIKEWHPIETFTKALLVLDFKMADHVLMFEAGKNPYWN
jgi:hypothetical protein